MLKSLRSPERLYAAAMWLITFLFASFLMGLGEKLLADAPMATPLPTLQEQVELAHPGRLEALRTQQREHQKTIHRLEQERQTLQADFERARRDSLTAREAHRNWVAARGVTADARHDAEVLRRTRELDALNANERTAQAAYAANQAALIEERQQSANLEAEEKRLFDEVRPQHERAQRAQELRVFGLRLALTLPLLLAAGWLIRHKRKSPYWPLARGFVLFAAFAFFTKLVPYLPSWGGYLRQVVGLAVVAYIAHKAAQWMQGYLARRRTEEQQSADARRARLDTEEALRKMAAGLCPGCERPILTTDDVKADHCVHCGLRLFDHCEAEGCGVRKNAFFPHCMKCGTKARRESAAAAGPAVPGTAAGTPA